MRRVTNFPSTNASQRIERIARWRTARFFPIRKCRADHPGVIARLDAARVRYVVETAVRKRKERPAFGTMLASRGRAVERPFAFAPVKAGEMTARQWHPDNAVTIDVHGRAARSRSQRPWARSTGTS